MKKIKRKQLSMDDYIREVFAHGDDRAIKSDGSKVKTVLLPSHTSPEEYLGVPMENPGWGEQGEEYILQTSGVESNGR